MDPDLLSKAQVDEIIENVIRHIMENTQSRMAALETRMAQLERRILMPPIRLASSRQED